MSLIVTPPARVLLNSVWSFGDCLPNQYIANGLGFELINSITSSNWPYPMIGSNGPKISSVMIFMELVGSIAIAGKTCAVDASSVSDKEIIWAPLSMASCTKKSHRAFCCSSIGWVKFVWFAYIFWYAAFKALIKSFLKSCGTRI